MEYKNTKNNIDYKTKPDFGAPYMLSYTPTFEGIRVHLSILHPESKFDLTQPTEDYFEKYPKQKADWKSRKYNKFYLMPQEEFDQTFNIL